MTEAEWLRCPNPFVILYHAQAKMSPRKLRLFAVACCRRLEHLLVDPRSRNALAVAENFADGLVDDAERARAGDDAFSVIGNVETGLPMPAHLIVGNGGNAGFMAADAARCTCSSGFDRYERGMYSPGGEDEAADAARAKAEAIFPVMQPAAIAVAYATEGLSPNAWETANYVTDSRGFIHHHDYNIITDVTWRAAHNAEWQAQLDLLREILGNPFHPVTLPRSCLSWNNCCVLQLATAIYDEQAFDRLPILADALEEAGCTSEHLLTHCRRPGGHVKGCWELDLALARS